MRYRWTLPLLALLAIHGKPVFAQDTVPVAPPAAPVMAKKGSYTEGLVQGELQANTHGTGGWGAGGFGGGCILGAIGCLSVTGAAYVVDPPTPRHILLDQQYSSEFQLGYQQGWEKRLKRRRVNSAFLGGTVGTLVLVGVWVAIVASAPAEEDDQSQAAMPLVRF